jgi:hypothetical protein
MNKSDFKMLSLRTAKLSGAVLAFVLPVAFADAADTNQPFKVRPPIWRT